MTDIRETVRRFLPAIAVSCYTHRKIASASHRRSNRLVNVGRTDEAQVAIDEVRRLYPTLTLDCIVANVHHMAGDTAAAGWRA